MATIQNARAKLEAKIPQMRANYSAGLSAFFGQDVSNSIPVRSYQAKVDGTMPQRWETGLRRAFGV